MKLIFSLLQILVLVIALGIPLESESVERQSRETGIPAELLQAFYSLSNRNGRFGPEWTFSSAELIDIGRDITVVWNDPNATQEQRDVLNAKENTLRENILAKWKQEIARVCLDCRIERVAAAKEGGPPEAKVYFGNQWIHIGKDPWVFETTGSPYSGDELVGHARTLNAILFLGAQKAGLKPHWRVGGGHRHIEDSSFFNGDLRVYVNFFVFIANNPEMFMGPLALDFTNSPPFALMEDEQKSALETVLREVEAGEITTIPEFKQAIKDRVYTKTFFYTRNQQMRPWKHHAFNVAHEVTSEIRAFRPQADIAHEMAIDVLLLAMRNHAASTPGYIKYKRKNYRDQVEVTMDRGMQTYTLKTSPAGVRAEYHKMLKTIGLNTPFFRNMSAEDFDKQLKAEALTECKRATAQ
jgi:hypothetical protein